MAFKAILVKEGPTMIEEWLEENIGERSAAYFEKKVLESFRKGL